MKLSCVRFAFAILLLACRVGATAPDQKQCVFALEIVKEGGGLQVEKNDSMMGTGIFIYEYSGGWLQAERHYRFHEFSENHDPKVDLFGSGVDFTAKMRTLLRDAHLRDFNFADAVAAAKNKGAQTHLAQFVITGAATERLYVALEGTEISVTYDGLLSTIDYYAEYNPELKRLKSLIDAIALEYGRARILH